MIFVNIGLPDSPHTHSSDANIIVISMLSMFLCPQMWNKCRRKKSFASDEICFEYIQASGVRCRQVQTVCGDTQVNASIINPNNKSSAVRQPSLGGKQ